MELWSGRPSTKAVVVKVRILLKLVGSDENNLNIFDATAGLGRDAFVLLPWL
ncbi:class I SAM-dependent methyltransferase [Marinomonas fungiae]|uniref:class I SAM-dependent methyltransferase n=1 Tax=Marinomonas fungiae TaxID=1137284 RepID=UPI003A91EC58